MKSIRLTLTKTDRTDLMCIECGGFRTDFAVHGPDNSNPQVGIHKVCAKKLVRKRAKKGGQPPAEAPVE